MLLHKEMSQLKILTTKGTIIVRLYDKTPLHRANFIKLVTEGFYNGTLFHRVIRDFMIQGGDPDSRGASSETLLGMGDPGYTLEAEIHPELFHKRGALAAARQGDELNPERRSSGSQFYIVWGKVYNEGQLSQIEQQMRLQAEQMEFQRLNGEYRETILQMRRDRNSESLLELQEKLRNQAKAFAKQKKFFEKTAREAYTTIGGTPFLDGQYTVFGEVVEGLDVVERIQNVETGNADRPLTDVMLEISVLNA